MNHVEQNIKDIEVSSSVLRNVYLGRCEINKNEACTAPRGEFTDFNVWLEDLSDVEMIEWTTCLYVKNLSSHIHEQFFPSMLLQVKAGGDFHQLVNI